VGVNPATTRSRRPLLLMGCRMDKHAHNISLDKPRRPVHVCITVALKTINLSLNIQSKSINIQFLGDIFCVFLFFPLGVWTNTVDTLQLIFAQYNENPLAPSTKIYYLMFLDWIFRLRLMVFNATFNNIFSYIVAVSFIGGRHRSTRRKPQTCRKSLRNFIT
jgi:hypothetical protein